MKRSETISLREAFNQFLSEEPDFHEHLLEVKVLSVLPEFFGHTWKQIVGTRIEHGTLYIRTYSSAIKHSLMLDKQAFITRINAKIEAELLRDLVLL